MSEEVKLEQKLNLITTVNSWKAATAVMNDIDQEVLMKVKDEGLEFHSMDPAHHVLINFLWSQENFEQFIKQNIEKIAFNVSELTKILKRFNNESDIKVYYEEAFLVFEAEEKQFKLRLIDPDFKEVPEIIARGETKFTIKTAELKSILDDMKITSPYVELKSEDGDLIFSSKEPGMTSKVKFSPGIEIADGSKISFSTEYLAIIGDMQSYCEELSITFGMHEGRPCPLLFEFDVPKVAIIRFFLAPRTET